MQNETFCSKYRDKSTFYVDTFTTAEEKSCKNPEKEETRNHTRNKKFPISYFAIEQSPRTSQCLLNVKIMFKHSEFSIFHSKIH